MASRHGERERSLADLDAFRITLELHRGLLADEALPERDQLASLTHDALLALAETFHEFDREAKRRAVQRARAQLSHLAAQLLIEHGLPPKEPAFDWLRRVEHEVLPTVAGLARFIDGLGRRK